MKMRRKTGFYTKAPYKILHEGKGLYCGYYWNEGWHFCGEGESLDEVDRLIEKRELLISTGNTVML